MFSQVSLFACVILAVCCLQIQAIALQRLNTNDSPATADLSELEQFLAEMNVESDRKLAEGSIPKPTNALSNIISGLLSGFTMAITPSLGPFGPLVAVSAPLINSAITRLVTNALIELGGILHHGEDLPGGHKTFKLNVPNLGSYILMADKPEVPPTIAQQPQIKNLFGNQFNGLQNLLNPNAFMDNQQPAPGQKFQQKNNLILVPLDQMNGLNGMNGLRRLIEKQLGRSDGDF